MRKKYIVFYDEDGLINQIGIWQKMSANGKRMMIEFIDYIDMLIICNFGGGIDTRYKSRIIENCRWMSTEEVLKSKHSFVELRDVQNLVDAFAESERIRYLLETRGEGRLVYDRRTT